MRKIIIPALLLINLGITSCRKSDSSQSGPYTSLSDVYQSLAVTSKTVTINATTGGSFYGDKGCRFIIPANGLQTMSGANVSGNVQIEVKEYLSRADMIFSNLLPISNGEPLQSGGEFYMNATQGGQKLLMKPGTLFQVNIPQNDTPATGMGLFLGKDSSGIVNWAPLIKNRAGSIAYNGDTISVFSDSVGYCNADKFMSNPVYQSFTIKPTVNGNTLSSTAILAYTLYDNYKGVWEMNNISSGVISEDHVPSIPVHFIVMTIVNGNFYAAAYPATPTNGSTYTVTLSKTDPITFKNLINGL